MVRREWLYGTGTGLMPFACCQPGNANEHQPHFLTKEIPRKKKENTKLGDISLIREC